MTPEGFRSSLQNHFEGFRQSFATAEGNWTVKGFIDVYRNIYTISADTKVVSKIIELMLFPALSGFASDHGFRLVLSEFQNHYPDITFMAPDETKYAVDLKSTYRTSATAVNGFTLGSFTGYFRHRSSNKNTTFPYQSYAAHFVLGAIYSRIVEGVDEKRVYGVDDLKEIASVVKDFTFLLQEKWRIAGDRPGSGNTKNIGSITDIQALITGAGPFVEFGEAVFDDYWMNFLTADMARAIDSRVPYRNLDEYWKWRKLAAR